MDRKYCVYKHTNKVNGKVYIGITHDVRKRWRGNGCAYKSNAHLWQAIQKYGWDNFNHEILFSGLSEPEACALEVQLIVEHDSQNREKGYNRSPGGENPLVTYTGENHHFYGKHLSGEHRAKLSAAKRGENHPWYGKHLPLETREKLSVAHRGREISEEQKQILREKNLGKRASDETKAKMSQSHMGHEVSEETRRKIRDTKKLIPVRQLSKTGEVIAVWESIADAMRGTGLSHSQISRCCKGELKTTGGFVWEFV